MGDAMAPVSKRARRGKPRAEDAEDASRDVVVDEEPSTSGARASGAPVYSADARRIELRPGAPVCVDGACVATCVAGECWIGGYHLSCDAPRDVVIRSASGIGSVVAAESSAPAALALRAADEGGSFAACELERARAFGWSPTVLSSDWSAVIASVAEAARVAQGACVAAFVGPKDVGKSTLARHAANAICGVRGHCAWLDLDCGQPELTAPGLVSLTILRAPLLGPPQTHQASGAEFAGAPAMPVYSRFVGDISPQGDPDAYLEGVFACIDAWSALGGHADERPPLVVNTSGWVKGLGLELAEDALRRIGRVVVDRGDFHVVNINSHVASRNVEDGVRWFCDERTTVDVKMYEVAAGFGTAPKGADAEADDTSVDTYEVNPNESSSRVRKAREVKTKRSANDSRALCWLAWSRQTVATCDEQPRQGALVVDVDGENEVFASTALDLMAATPWRVSFDDVKIHVLQGDLDSREALIALNGAVVGLLKSSTSGSECVGLGVVRGIDVDERFFYVLTPVPSDKLACVETLALGKLEFPPRLLGPSGDYPYMQVGAIANDGTGSKAIKARNNILRQNATPTPRR